MSNRLLLMVFLLLMASASFATTFKDVARIHAQGSNPRGWVLSSRAELWLSRLEVAVNLYDRRSVGSLFNGPGTILRGTSMRLGLDPSGKLHLLWHKHSAEGPQFFIIGEAFDLDALRPKAGIELQVQSYYEGYIWPGLPVGPASYVVRMVHEEQSLASCPRFEGTIVSFRDMMDLAIRWAKAEPDAMTNGNLAVATSVARNFWAVGMKPPCVFPDDDESDEFLLAAASRIYIEPLDAATGELTPRARRRLAKLNRAAIAGMKAAIVNFQSIEDDDDGESYISRSLRVMRKLLERAEQLQLQLETVNDR